MFQKGTTKSQQAEKKFEQTVKIVSTQRIFVSPQAVGKTAVWFIFHVPMQKLAQARGYHFLNMDSWCFPSPQWARPRKRLSEGRVPRSPAGFADLLLSVLMILASGTHPRRHSRRNFRRLQRCQAKKNGCWIGRFVLQVAQKDANLENV